MVQVYVKPVHPSVVRPPQELKGFAKVSVEPGKTVTATITLDRSSFAHFDTDSNSWKVDAGDYVIEAGSSSRDLPLTKTITW